MKRFLCVLAAMLLLILAGCDAVDPSRRTSMRYYDEEQYKALESNRDSLRDELNELKEQYEELNTSYSKLKEETSAFMELSEEERELEIARMEEEVEARRAEEEAKKKAEEEARRQEEAKGYETGITFLEISRSPDDYIGSKVKFTGYVLQVIEGFGTNAIRMSTNGRYDDVIYGTYSKSILDIRLLDGDNITIYGTAQGLKTYETVLGSSVTLPEISIDQIEVH